MIGISAFFVFYEETDKGIVFSNEYDKKEPKDYPLALIISL